MVILTGFFFPWRWHVLDLRIKDEIRHVIFLLVLPLGFAENFTVDLGDILEWISCLIESLSWVKVFGTFWQNGQGDDQSDDATDEIDQLEREPVPVELLVVETPKDDAYKFDEPVKGNDMILVSLGRTLDGKIQSNNIFARECSTQDNHEKEELMDAASV